MFFVNKQKKIESDLSSYRQSVSDCLAAFKDAMDIFNEGEE